ncbi:MAG: AI-2E family transporter [Ignavibacteriales bacterium]|nr:AI-2E family transporter [Ignavibacteriales bacterium]
MKEEKNFFRSRHWKVFLVTMAIALPIFVLSTFEDLFLILVVSFTLTFILKPIVDYIENLGAVRWFAVLLVFTGLGSIVVLVIFLLLPVITTQVSQISAAFGKDQLPKMLNELSTQISFQVPFLKSEAIREQLNSALIAFGNAAGSTLSSLVGTAASLMIVPFITFFLLNDYYSMQKSFIRNMSNKYFEMTLNILNKIEDQLSKYIRGTVTESAIVAVLYTICYFSFGINYATVLGMIGGITNVIPFAGPFIGAIPVLLISIIQFGDLSMLPWIAIITIGIQQIDQMLIQPAVFSRIMDIHPLTMFIVILVGNETLGVMGMVLAVPIYTIILVTAKETNWGLKNYRITQV